MFDHLLDSSHRDDSNKWSNIGFGQEITELAMIEVYFTHLIWISGHYLFSVAGFFPGPVLASVLVRHCQLCVLWHLHKHAAASGQQSHAGHGPAPVSRVPGGLCWRACPAVGLCARGGD